jgi:altronate hydrolase
MVKKFKDSIHARSADFLRLNTADNVVVLPWGGERGDEVCGARLPTDVPPWHKIASAPIRAGKAVVKYGHTIGSATADILPGDWVHEHNVATRIGADEACLPKWSGSSAARDAALPYTDERHAFMGYRRQRGKPGVRNELWIVPTTGCINGELRSIASRYRKPYWIDAVRVLEHPYGCSQIADDIRRTRDILAGLVRNPNAAGVVLAGLGCEDMHVSEVLEQAGFEDTVKRVKQIVLQDESEEKIPEYLDELAANSPRVREPFPLSDLRVGVKCGGGDGCSGLTANPLAGRFADALTAQGGTIIAAGIPEMFGAEDVIASRICDERVFERFHAVNRLFRGYVASNDRPICEPPSPVSRKEGITTREEQSLGAIEKTGSALVTRVLEYGEQAGGEGCVQIAFSPVNDLVSCTSLAGSGAQIILFTTGRGAPLGAVVPTIKISANTSLFDRRPDWIDFDAGTLLNGESWESAAKRLTEYVISVASGEKVAHEKKNFGEIAIFKDGVTI